MSLYGALYSGVSGLTAQSSKIGTISDNIANVNTVGYKGGIGGFQTLVTTAASASTYSPGGVLASTRQQVSRQGLLQTTDSPTDIAISGGGFFVVNQTFDATGQTLFTRAGSFRQDATGNFRNAAGFFLQAWPLDGQGRLPGDPGNANTTSAANLSSLRTVNVQSSSGVAASTTDVAIGANLSAGQAVFPGAGKTTTMDALHAVNFGIKAKDIIVPGGVNSLTRGDKFTALTGSGLPYTYRYGGFTFGRNISTAAVGDNDQELLTSPTSISSTAVDLGNNPAATIGGAGTTTVRITQTAHGLANGDVVTLASLVAFDGLVAGELNATHVISNVTANTFDITVATGATAGGVTGGGNTPATSTTEPFKTTNATNVVTVRHASHGLVDGAVVTLNGVSATVNNIPASNFNTSFVVDVIDDDHYTITTATNANATGGGGGAGINSVTRPFVGNILDATDSSQPFLITTGTSGFTAAALKFSITTATAGTVTFSYTAASPIAQNGQFNNMTNLAAAINAVNGLSARVDSNRLYVSATNANEAITFTNGSTTGISGPPVQSGLDWVRELGLESLPAATDRFSSLEGLATLVNASPGISATITNPLGAAALTINVDDPLDTITFSDKSSSAALAALGANTIATTNGSTLITLTLPSAHGFQVGEVVAMSAAGIAGAGPFNGIPKANFTGNFEIVSVTTSTFSVRVATAATSSGNIADSGLVVTPPNNTGSILAELGFVTSLSGAVLPDPRPTTGVLGPAYNPNDSTKNMASGAIPPQFSRPMQVFDAQGTGHDLTVAFIKTATNTWAVEVFAVPASDITTSFVDGQVAFGNITFNGDGTLNSVDTALSQPISITWNNGASASTVTFNWGTAGQEFGTPNASAIGKADGLSQFNSSYRVNFVNQNGAPVGELVGVAIDEDGFIIASYNNGQTQKLYKVPLASFANPDQLGLISGNVFSQTSESGEVNLRQPGTSGVGSIASSSLEQSNVELAEQLTNMIVSQRAYQANTKVITTADSLLEELNRIS